MNFKPCYLCFFSFLFLCVERVPAQRPDDAAVMEPIARMFEGMQLGDSVMVRSAFTVGATLSRVIRDKAGQVVLRREATIENFLKAVGTPHSEPWHESIWDVRMERDGDFAHVWASYAFYLGKKFSHCGVDSFQLIHQNGMWKIFHLTDTSRKEGCEVPEEIQKRFQN
jgi:hypothetical protein